MVEILIVVALSGILLSVGYATFPRERLAARETARLVAADLQRARSEAVRLNTRVAVSFSDAQTCGRWCMFTDYDRTGRYDPERNANLYGTDTNDDNFISDADFTGARIDNPLLQARQVESGPTISIASADFGDAVPTIWFDVRGLPTTSSGGLLGTTGTVVVAASGTPAYAVRLEPSGRIEVEER